MTGLTGMTGLAGLTGLTGLAGVTGLAGLAGRARASRTVVGSGTPRRCGTVLLSQRPLVVAAVLTLGQ